MALHLLLRTKTLNNSFRNPSLIHLFSTSSSNSNSNDDEPESSEDRDSSKSHLDSYFSDVKKVLKQHQSFSPSSTLRITSTPSFTASGSVPQSASNVASLEEIRKNLSSFRSRYSDPNSTPSSSSSAPSANNITFQELYKRHVLAKSGDSPQTSDSGPARLGSKVSLDAIRQSVLNRGRNVESSGSGGKGVNSSLLQSFTKTLTMKPSTVIGGTGELPASIFGKEMREKEGGEMSEEARFEYLKKYRHEELGDRLRKLRPEAKGENWFSLSELNDRLMKFREMDEESRAAQRGMGFTHQDFRDVLIGIQVSENSSKRNLLDKFDILGEYGKRPSFMLKPPQEHLVEKYFHPDNMSSAEKLKIELAKVRDEFKMSESDCGSSRVQVAQLTTKIKHLSSVLHKKDKHSRKGLLAMVQKRKRLLKYLRRTDWDSYCFVISKLGLRDNPDTKY